MFLTKNYKLQDVLVYTIIGTFIGALIGFLLYEIDKIDIPDQH